MTALGMVLKSMGINVTDEQRQMVEVLIPQIPARFMQAVQAVNLAVQRVNENTAVINEVKEEILQVKTEITGMRQDFVKLCDMLGKVLEAHEHGRRTDLDSTTGIDTNGATTSGGGRYVAGNPAKRKRTNGNVGGS